MEKIEFKEQERGRYTSASNALADTLCPGRHILSRDMPDVESGDAKHGTAIHEALRRQDPEGLSVDQKDIYETCNEIEAELLVRYFGEEVRGLKASPVRERRFWIAWPDGNRHSGQIDSAHRKGTRALIVEYKTLSGDVAASPKNLQLRDQVCLFEAGTPLLNEVAVAVIQPLATHTPEICVYAKADILRARDELYNRVNTSNKPDSPRIPGELQCKYCKAKTVCAEFQKWSGSILPAPQDLFKVSMSNWTPEQRTLIADILPVAFKRLEEIDTFLFEGMTKQEGFVPGYHLEPGQKRETLTNPQGIFESFSKMGGSLEQFMKCIGVVKSKLKAELAVVTDEKGKALDSALRGIIGSNSEIKETKPSMKKDK